MIHFLTSGDVIIIHSRMIKAYGGLDGCADTGRVESMATRIINRHLYEGENELHMLAAAYLLAIARGHCFNDANKRTAFASAALFLRKNGLTLKFSSSHEQMTVDAAQGLLSINQLAEQLKNFTARSSFI